MSTPNEAYIIARRHLGRETAVRKDQSKCQIGIYTRPPGKKHESVFQLVAEGDTWEQALGTMLTTLPPAARL